MKKSLILAAGAALWAGAVLADAFTDSIVANLQDLGYEFIEIKNGPTQVKVEAIRGTDKLELIYDRTTGDILKRERERAEADEIGRSGVQIDTRNKDFIDGRDDDDDDGDDDRSGRRGGDDDDDDDDRSGSGGGDDDHDDDDHDDDDDDDHDDDDDDDDDEDKSGRG
jgi:hypothetical protein